MSSLFKAYKSLLFRYPRTIQALQTGILVATGDVISQVAIEKQPINNINCKRTLQYFAVGAFYVGPALTIWYGFLDRQVGSGGKIVAFKKVALDQICFAPIGLLGFLICINFLQGKSFENIQKMIIRDFRDVLVANYKLWPAAQLINFSVVPLQYQVLYAQLVAVFWNTYLCFKTKPDQQM